MEKVFARDWFTSRLSVAVARTSQSPFPLSDEQLQIAYTYLTSKLRFISEELIPEEIWLCSEKITKEIDIDDTDFVALATFLSASLWTGDKVLYNELKKLDVIKVLNTSELLSVRNLPGKE